MHGMTVTAVLNGGLPSGVRRGEFGRIFGLIKYVRVNFISVPS